MRDENKSLLGAIEEARAAAMLGPDVMHAGFAFDLELSLLHVAGKPCGPFDAFELLVQLREQLVPPADQLALRLVAHQLDLEGRVVDEDQAVEPDVELGGDAVVGLALRQQPQCLQLAWREVGEWVARDAGVDAECIAFIDDIVADRKSVV